MNRAAGNTALARAVRPLMRQLYLDCDGVLADFDKGATAVLRLHPRAFEKRHGLGRFWQKLATAPDFYFGLPLMDDAMQLSTRSVTSIR